MLQVSYSQHYIFLLTCEWAQKTSVLLYTRLERLANKKHSSILCPFIGYEENKVMWIRPLLLNFSTQSLIFVFILELKFQLFSILPWEYSASHSIALLLGNFCFKNVLQFFSTFLSNFKAGKVLARCYKPFYGSNSQTF
jgi:hypothetical protein